MDIGGLFATTLGLFEVWLLVERLRRHKRPLREDWDPTRSWSVGDDPKQPEVFFEPNDMTTIIIVPGTPGARVRSITPSS